MKNTNTSTLSSFAKDNIIRTQNYNYKQENSKLISIVITTIPTLFR